MSEEPFERKLARDLVEFADRGIRPIDAHGLAAAISSRRAARSSLAGLSGLPSYRVTQLAWGAVLAAVLLVGVAVIAGQFRRSDPVPGPLPDVLRHSWQRPLPVAPGPDLWGSGFLSLAGGQPEFGREPGAGASRTAIETAGLDTLVLTATSETIGCAVGDVGTYRWSVDGKGTVLTLTAPGPDACAGREKALAGPWVRSDFPPRPEGTLTAGSHLTSRFDAYGEPTAPRRLSFTVPGGWSVIDDTATWFALLYAPDAPPGKGSGELFVAILTAPRAAADVPARAACDSPVADAPGVGGRADDLVAAIRARPGVISTLQTPVTIDGHDGRVLDLEFASSWTGGCQAPDGTEGGVAVLHEAGSATGPVVGVGPDYPVRVILMDLSEDRTLAIVIRDVGPVQRSRFEAHVAAAMPIIKSFQFDSRSP